jgi:hypothetical protein
MEVFAAIWEWMDIATRISLVVSIGFFILTMGLIDRLLEEIFWNFQGRHFKPSVGMILAWIPVGLYMAWFYLSGVWVEYDLRYLIPVLLGYNLIVPYFIWFVGYIVHEVIRIYRDHRQAKILTLKRRSDDPATE